MSFRQIDADGNIRLAKRRCVATPRCESTTTRVWLCSGNVLDPQEILHCSRTRNGTTAHSRKVVQGSDAYLRPIKTAARNRFGCGRTASRSSIGAVEALPASSLQRGRRAMEFFTGLDVGMDETAVCVVDDKGKVALETMVVLIARAMLWKQYCRLHDLAVKFVAGHELCRRFMQIPGVGPVT